MSSTKEKVELASASISIIGGVSALITSNTTVSAIALGVFILVMIFIMLNRYRSPFEYKLGLHEVTVDILDPEGKNAEHTLKTQMEVMKNNSFYYTNAITSDGEVEGASTNIGSIVEEKKESGEFKYKCTLGHKRHKGDMISREFRCVMKNSFTENEEYYKYTHSYPGGVVKISVLFPPERQPRDFWAEQYIGHYDIRPPYEPVMTMINGKTALELTIPKIEVNESYCLRWRW